ncbi:MAG: SAM hydroxide adenosyltransferase [Patescibacteria group bacterium]
MFVSIITDCRDDNARTRQETRYAHLFPGMHVSFVGAATDSEAAGNLLDILDSADDAPGVIAVNCAPRHGRAKKWKNGSPFGYVWIGNKLVVGTIDGQCFSFLKRFALVSEIRVTDITTALPVGDYTSEQVETATHTQFRSLNYLPRLAKILWEHHDVPSETLPITDVDDMPSLIWWIDSFGNAKTSLTAHDINFKTGARKQATFADGTTISLPCVERLANVTDHEPALIVGSSGIKSERFVEIVVQGGSAAERFNLHKADAITIN